MTASISDLPKMSIRTVDKSFIKVVKRLYNRRRPIAGKVSGMPRISLNISYLT